MADNILVTPGSGRNVRATDVGSDTLVQHVKSVDDAVLDAAVFQTAGSIAYSTLTGTLATLLALSDDTRIVILSNTTDVDAGIGVSGNLLMILPPRSIFALDLAANGLKTTDTIQAKYNDTAASRGSVYATGISG